MRNRLRPRSALPHLPAVAWETTSGEKRPDALPHPDIEQLARDHHAGLIRFLVARLHSLDEANEVAQDAYIRLLNLRDPGALGYLQALLYRTAQNLVIDRIRQRQRRAELDQQVLPQLAALSSPPAPERLWVAREDLAVIEESLKELPPRCRTIFLLHRVEDLGVEEIAERMNCTVRSVWRYIARAMAHCQLRLEQAGRAGGGRETQPSTQIGSGLPERHPKPRT